MSWKNISTHGNWKSFGKRPSVHNGINKLLFIITLAVCLGSDNIVNQTMDVYVGFAKSQGHPTDRFGGISVRKTCNRLKFSVREMSSRAFLINAFCFRRDKNGTKSVS